MLFTVNFDLLFCRGSTIFTVMCIVMCELVLWKYIGLIILTRYENGTNMASVFCKIGFEHYREINEIKFDELKQNVQLQLIYSRTKFMAINHIIMMTSSNGSIFRVTGPLGGDRWISLRNASDAVLWRLIWSAPEQTIEQTIETPGIWNAIAPIMPSI